MQILEKLFIYKKKRFFDNRGFFQEAVLEKEIKTKIKFTAIANSKKNVIRGMHFQVPPFTIEKLIFVPKGEILDVVLDIRKESPTYGKYIVYKLSEYNNRSIFIPKGCAHGFLGKEDYNLVVYMQTSVYKPDADDGINYNSFGYKWDVDNPILSNKDRKMPDFTKFNSPF